MAAEDEADFAAFAYHGGALDVARRLFPDAPAPWIDLSTGVNPDFYPIPTLDPRWFTRLPQQCALDRLQTAAARRYGAAPPSVVIASGTQALIAALALLKPKAEVGVLAPTYVGHEDGWLAAGARVWRVATVNELSEFDIGVVVNPNNPDGRVVRAVELIALTKAMRPGALLVVDEAFADFDDAETLAPLKEAERIVVLRSFGKSYGLAGLRLGFALAQPDFAKRLRAILGPWPVSGAAMAIAESAFADDRWFAAARASAKARAARLDMLLWRAGWRIVGGTSLFRLADKADGAEAFRALLRAGILTRPFADQPARIRFGLPANECEWGRLAAALGSQDPAFVALGAEGERS